MCESSDFQIQFRWLFYKRKKNHQLFPALLSSFFFLFIVFEILWSCSGEIGWPTLVHLIFNEPNIYPYSILAESFWAFQIENGEETRKNIYQKKYQRQKSRFLKDLHKRSMITKFFSRWTYRWIDYCYNLTTNFKNKSIAERKENETKRKKLAHNREFKF